MEKLCLNEINGGEQMLNLNKKGNAIALALLVFLGIAIVSTQNQALKQTILDFLKVIFG